MQKSLKKLETLTIPSLFILETCFFKNFKQNNNIKTNVFIHTTLKNFEESRTKQHRLNDLEIYSKKFDKT